MQTKKIIVVGAGPVGSLLAILLARRGHQVRLFDKRSTLHTAHSDRGRTINLALSDRGWQALEQVGLAQAVRQHAIPMFGRAIHTTHGPVQVQPYGREQQAIYSVSRGMLNHVLLTQAEAHPNVSVHVGQKCIAVDIKQPAVQLVDTRTQTVSVETADVLIGTDGAFSDVRSSLQRASRINFSQQFIEHGYKELTIPPTADGRPAMAPDALHIWPRGNFMLIALPNTDNSFTGTLFFPFEGTPSFGSVQSRAEVNAFFAATFPDAVALMPNLADEYLDSPASSLVSIDCYPWSHQDKVLLVGDASHAILPFYGQGMNAGFEDCVVFDQLLNTYTDDWQGLFEAFQRSRYPNTQAIAELALANFIEMRDKLSDPAFLLQKKIDAHLQANYPDVWMSVYALVAFSNTPYAEAAAVGRRQERLMADIMQIPNIETCWQTIDYGSVLYKGVLV